MSKDKKGYFSGKSGRFHGRLGRDAVSSEDVAKDVLATGIPRANTVGRANSLGFTVRRGAAGTLLKFRFAPSITPARRSMERVRLNRAMDKLRKQGYVIEGNASLARDEQEILVMGKRRKTTYK